MLEDRLRESRHSGSGNALDRSEGREPRSRGTTGRVPVLVVQALAFDVEARDSNTPVEHGPQPMLNAAEGRTRYRLWASCSVSDEVTRLAMACIC